MTDKPQSKLAPGAWGEKITYTMPPLKAHKCPLFAAGHISAYVVGGSGAGKSVCVLNMLPNIEDLAQVCIFTLVPDNPVNEVISQWCNEHAIQYMCCSDPETGQSALEEFIKQKPPDKAGICVCDDFVRQNARPDDPYKLFITGIAQFLRNVKYHNIMMTQSPKGLPEGVRNNVNLRIIFKCESPKSLVPISDEFECAGMGPPRYFNALYHGMLKGGRFSYLCLVSDQDEPRIFIHLQNRGENHMARLPTFEQADRKGEVRIEDMNKGVRKSTQPKLLKEADESDSGSDDGSAPEDVESEPEGDSEPEDETRAPVSRNKTVVIYAAAGSRPDRSRTSAQKPAKARSHHRKEDHSPEIKRGEIKTVRRMTKKKSEEPVIQLRKRYQRTQW